MGVRTPLEKMVQQIEWGVNRVEKDVTIDKVEYKVKCYRPNMAIRINLVRKRRQNGSST